MTSWSFLARHDQAIQSQTRRAYVLINNRSEGNAPSTVQALSDRLNEATT
jgi:hypothetical protein